MIVDKVRVWGGGRSVPNQFHGAGPHEITLSMIDELSKIFDVAIMNHRTKEGPLRVLWLDKLGGGFKTR